VSSASTIAATPLQLIVPPVWLVVAVTVLHARCCASILDHCQGCYRLLLCGSNTYNTDLGNGYLQHRSGKQLSVGFRAIIKLIQQPRDGKWKWIPESSDIYVCKTGNMDNCISIFLI
jgi:hypothetical protein